MKIINPLLATNTVSVLPREIYTDIGVTLSTLVFVNEDTDLVTTIVPSSVDIVSNDLVFSIEVPDFKEGERYTFKALKLTEEVFRGTVLVTQYNDTNYTMNNNEFVIDTNTDSDSIKVYE
jgi:hypothetical protein